MYKIISYLKMHGAILNSIEKKHFFTLCTFFLISALLDIFGMGAISYFLVIMMDPSLLNHVPILRSCIPATWPVTPSLMVIGGLILVAFLLKTSIGCIIQKKLVAYCFKVGGRIRVELMKKYLYAPYCYLVANHTSDLINRILTLTTNYINLNLISLMTISVHMVFVIAVMTFLFVMHPFVTSLLIIMIGCMLVVYMFFVKDKLAKSSRDIGFASGEMVKNVQEALFGLKEVRVLAKESYFLKRLEDISTIYSEANGTIAVYQKFPLYFLESGMFIFIIALCLIELKLHANYQVIISLCGLIVTAGIRILPSLYQIAVGIILTQGSQHSLETIYKNLFHVEKEFNNELSWQEAKVDDLKNDVSNRFSSIQLHNVSYCYPNSDKYALDGISLTIKQGQSIGIIGLSGAGKSTLVDLILGLLKPTMGSISVDGKYPLSQRDWINRFAYIPQTIHLLDATVKENIVYGEPISTVDQRKLLQSIKMAQLHEVIENLPKGIDSTIGENGIRLSGGQRQRIALARAFYHERDIIIMDEATAALDNETEHAVVAAIKKLQHVKTLIIIAHRLSTVEHCDAIYQLQQGKIVAHGSFNQLITNNRLRYKSGVSQ